MRSETICACEGAVKAPWSLRSTWNLGDALIGIKICIYILCSRVWNGGRCASWVLRLLRVIMTASVNRLCLFNWSLDHAEFCFIPDASVNIRVLYSCLRPSMAELATCGARECTVKEFINHRFLSGTPHNDFCAQLCQELSCAPITEAPEDSVHLFASASSTRHELAGRVIEQLIYHHSGRGDSLDLFKSFYAFSSCLPHTVACILSGRYKGKALGMLPAYLCPMRPP